VEGFRLQLGVWDQHGQLPNLTCARRMRDQAVSARIGQFAIGPTDADLSTAATLESTTAGASSFYAKGLAA
jgi:hypothetical protein